MAQTTRRRMGYWDPFNTWWRAYVDQHQKRPKVHDMKKWYDANAEQAWGGQGPTWEETKKHSKGMRRIEEVSEYFREYRRGKKRRAGGYAPDSNSSSDDSEGDSPGASKPPKRKPKAPRKSLPGNGATTATTTVGVPSTAAANTDDASPSPPLQLLLPPQPQAPAPPVHRHASASQIGPPGPRQGSPTLFGVPIPGLPQFHLGSWFGRAASLPTVPLPGGQRSPPHPTQLDVQQHHQQQHQQQQFEAFPSPQQRDPGLQHGDLQREQPYFPPHDQHQQQRQTPGQRQQPAVHPVPTLTRAPAFFADRTVSDHLPALALPTADAGAGGGGQQPLVPHPAAPPPEPFRHPRSLLSIRERFGSIAGLPPLSEEAGTDAGAGAGALPGPHGNGYDAIDRAANGHVIGDGGGGGGGPSVHPAAYGHAAAVGAAAAAAAGNGAGGGFSAGMMEIGPAPPQGVVGAGDDACGPGGAADGSAGGGMPGVMEENLQSPGGEPLSSPSGNDADGNGGGFFGRRLFSRGSTLRRVRSLFYRWASSDAPEPGCGSPTEDPAGAPSSPLLADAAAAAAGGPSDGAVPRLSNLEGQQQQQEHHHQQHHHNHYAFMGRWAGLLGLAPYGEQEAAPNPFGQATSPVISQSTGGAGTGGGFSPRAWLMGRRSRESAGGASPQLLSTGSQRLQRNTSLTSPGPSRTLHRWPSLTASPGRSLQRGLSGVLRPLLGMLSFGRRSSNAMAQAADEALAAVAAEAEVQGGSGSATDAADTAMPGPMSGGGGAAISDPMAPGGAPPYFPSHSPAGDVPPVAAAAASGDPMVTPFVEATLQAHVAAINTSTLDPLALPHYTHHPLPLSQFAQDGDAAAAAAAAVSGAAAGALSGSSHLTAHHHNHHYHPGGASMAPLYSGTTTTTTTTNATVAAGPAAHSGLSPYHLPAISGSSASAGMSCDSGAPQSLPTPTGGSGPNTDLGPVPGVSTPVYVHPPPPADNNAGRPVVTTGGPGAGRQPSSTPGRPQHPSHGQVGALVGGSPAAGMEAAPGGVLVGHHASMPAPSTAAGMDMLMADHHHHHHYNNHLPQRGASAGGAGPLEAATQLPPRCQSFDETSYPASAFTGPGVGPTNARQLQAGLLPQSQQYDAAAGTAYQGPLYDSQSYPPSHEAAGGTGCPPPQLRTSLSARARAVSLPQMSLHPHSHPHHPHHHAQHAQHAQHGAAHPQHPQHRHPGGPTFAPHPYAARHGHPHPHPAQPHPHPGQPSGGGFLWPRMSLRLMSFRDSGHPGQQHPQHPHPGAPPPAAIPGGPQPRYRQLSDDVVASQHHPHRYSQQFGPHPHPHPGQQQQHPQHPSQYAPQQQQHPQYPAPEHHRNRHPQQQMQHQQHQRLLDPHAHPYLHQPDPIQLGPETATGPHGLDGAAAEEPVPLREGGGSMLLRFSNSFNEYLRHIGWNR